MALTDVNLDAKENLFDGDSGTPVFLLVQNGKADLYKVIEGVFKPNH